MHDLRLFFDDLTAWDWAERPAATLLHRTDIPRLPQPLPRALSPDVDAALLTAVTGLTDQAARCRITLLRGAGLRLGELLDLELDCLWDLPRHGTWLKVPLGKLMTERVVPLDDTALAALDSWMAVRGRQRALPHPRTGRPVDFLLTLGGQRIGASRICRWNKQVPGVRRGERWPKGGTRARPASPARAPHARPAGPGRG